MRTKKAVSRRRFLKSSGALAGASLLRITAPSLLAITEAACTAKQEAAAFKVLGELEAADFAAIAARIIPTTETPGATEAGVIYFFDNAFAAEMSWALEDMRAGLAALNATLTDDYANKSHFFDLAENDQDAVLSTNEATEFFELCWLTTMFGFFSMSKHGGNKDHVAWDLIGFEGHHGAWDYPFGYYDAEYAKELSHGE
jgi:hypothetical protein